LKVFPRGKVLCSEQILDDLENFQHPSNTGSRKGRKIDPDNYRDEQIFSISGSTADQWLQKSKMEELRFY
jgi:hypothetical protein